MSKSILTDNMKICSFRFMEISFDWLFYKYLPQSLSFKCFLHPPKIFLTVIFFAVRESDYQPNMQLLMEHLRGSRIFFHWAGP